MTKVANRPVLRKQMNSMGPMGIAGFKPSMISFRLLIARRFPPKKSVNCFRPTTKHPSPEENRVEIRVSSTQSI